MSMKFGTGVDVFSTSYRTNTLHGGRLEDAQSAKWAITSRAQVRALSNHVWPLAVRAARDPSGAHPTCHKAYE